MLGLRSIASVFDSYRIASGIVLAAFSAPVAAENLSYAPNAIAVQQMPNVDFGWVKGYLQSLKEDIDPEDLVDFLVSMRMSLVGMGFEPPSIQELCSNLSGWVSGQGLEDELDMLSEMYDIAVEKESDLSATLTTAQYRPSHTPNILLARHKKKTLRMDEDIEKALYKGAKKAGMPIRQYLDCVINAIRSGQAGPGDFSRVMKYALRLRDYLDHPGKYERLMKFNDTKKDKAAIALCEMLAGALLIIVPCPPVQAVGIAMVAHGGSSLCDVGVEMSDENRKKQDQLPPPVETIPQAG